MRLLTKYIILVSSIICLYSCSVIEKASRHGFESDYYSFKSNENEVEEVYADLGDDKIEVYQVTENHPGNKIMTIPLITTDSLFDHSVVFTEKSIDIDLTTILFKYRFAVSELPPQMNTEFNLALYAGWRHDNYHFKSKRDPLGKYHNEIINRGYDFGFFAGTGTTLISPFTTHNLYDNEYNGWILQFGLAGFLESGIASFGISTGFDYLLSPDRDIWIYNKKPWIGFIIGVALN
jgi:hypothetical protein